MTQQYKVDWFKDDVILAVNTKTVEALRAVALRVVERAAINITENDQIDTGAMRAGIYATWPGGSDYENAATAALSLNDEAEAAPPPPLVDPELSALVAAAMDYSIWQELDNPFLYPALVATATEAEGVIKTKVKPF